MKNLGTLRQLILRHSSDEERSKIFNYLFRKDSETIPGSSENMVTLENTTASYSHVIDELLSKPQTVAFKMPISVIMATDDFENPPTKYVDVCLLNPDYVPAPEGLKPWGCRKGQEPPAGHYNINDDKFSKYFAFGFCSWSELIDTPVLDDTGLEEYEVLAEVLWEMTFYGWTEERNNERMNKIEEQCVEAMKEIEEGKFIKLPKISEEDYDVCVPDSVLEDLRKELE